MQYLLVILVTVVAAELVRTQDQAAQSEPLWCVTSDLLPAFEQGMSVQAVHDILQAHRRQMEAMFPGFEIDHPEVVVLPLPLLLHQFTAQYADRTIECWSAGLWSTAFIHGHSSSYYFVFVNGELDRIVEPPKTETQTVVINELPVAQRSVDPLIRASAVLESTPLPLDVFTAVAADCANRHFGIRTRAKFQARREQAERELEQLPPNVRDRLRALEGQKAPRARYVALYEQLDSVRKEFAPSKIAIGMSRAEASAAFKTVPLRTLSHGHAEFLVYGRELQREAYAGILERYELPWIAIRVENDLVTGLYSNDFFDPKWCE